MLGGEIRQGPIKVKVIDLCKKCAKPKTKQGFAPALFTLHCKCVQGVTVIHRLTVIVSVRDVLSYQHRNLSMGLYDQIQAGARFT